ncbi:MAG: hypothetical protein EYC62_00080 [Alphaproteobacteria bacterium]|nr:MAG: hypothetical protein EYC62_00080 [Alphaproteobacteria bacterium]
MNYKLQNLGALTASLSVLGPTIPIASGDIAHSNFRLTQPNFLSLEQQPTIETTPYGIRRNIKDLVPLPPAAGKAQKNKVMGAVSDHEVWFGEQDGYKIEAVRIYADQAGNWLGDAPAPDNLDITVWKTGLVGGKLMWQLVVDSNGMQDDATTVQALYDLRTRVDAAYRHGDKNAAKPLMRVLYLELPSDKPVKSYMDMPTFVGEVLDWSANGGNTYLKSFIDFLDQSIKLGNQLLPQMGKAHNLPASSIFLAAARMRDQQRLA